MGSFTSLLIDGYDLWGTRSYADRESLSLFREADRRVRLRCYTSTPEQTVEWTSSWLSLGAADAAVQVGEDGSAVVTLPDGAGWMPQVGDPHTLPTPGPHAASDIQGLFAANAYVSSVAAVRDRLDAMGFTRDAAARVLAAAVVRDLADLDGELHALEEDGYYVQRRAVLMALSFEAWLAAFAWIMQRGAHEVDDHLDGADFGGYLVRSDETTPLVRFLLERDGEHVFGFPRTVDPRFLFRAALEVCPPEAEVALDLTAVISSGYHTERQRLVEEAHRDLAARTPADAPTIVLTEGPSDGRAIRGALRVLYPHLEDLYTFMDFSAMRVPGSAPALVATVKAFAGAGVANRVVALFDNDAAAHEALRELRGVPLPANVRVLTYPSLPLAAAYPTDGPSGAHVLDVNGKAASLELYFGKDVLQDESGDLTLVEWGAPKPGVGRYHGEVRDKRRLQERFAAKLAAAEENPEVMPEQDWSGMHAILDVLRRAFA